MFGWEKSRLLFGWGGASDFKKIETGHIHAFSSVKYDQLNGIVARSPSLSLSLSLTHTHTHFYSGTHSFNMHTFSLSLRHTLFLSHTRFSCVPYISFSPCHFDGMSRGRGTFEKGFLPFYFKLSFLFSEYNKMSSRLSSRPFFSFV